MKRPTWASAAGVTIVWVVLGAALVAQPATAETNLSATEESRVLHQIVPAEPDGDVSTALSAELLDGRDENGIIVGASAALEGLDLTSPVYDRLVEEKEANEAFLQNANDRATTALDSIEQLEREATALDEHLERAETRSAKLDEEFDELRTDIRTLMVKRYVTGSDFEPFPDRSKPIDERLDDMQTSTLTSVASESATRSLASISQATANSSQRLEDLSNSIAANAATLATAREELKVALTDSLGATESLERLEPEMQEARATSTVSGTDMTLVAFDAYWRASAMITQTNPSCGIEWWALAGIGRTESRHGQHSGGTPTVTGEIDVPIRGIALDGTNNTQAIGDTDGGALDGDPFTDRAVGPMQFIPSTWVRFAQDMTGDDNADPNNIYDAALAAANYLCRYGPGLDDDPGLRRAFFGYNRSESYVELVLSRARGYQSAVLVPQQI